MTAIAAATSGIWRVFEHRFITYRRTFRASIFSSFLTPVLFLAAMGLGIGGYVDRGGTAAALGSVPYIAFLAPGLLVASCMQAGSFEATFPIMAGLVWSRVFHAMYATPITPRDVALGNIVWFGARLLLVSSVFTIVIVLFGAAISPLVVLAIPVATLTGLAFATPIAAFSATQRTPDRFAAIFRFGITPLFLFSGTFYPVESLPAIVQPLAWITPLYHGVTLARGLSLGTLGTPTLPPALALVHLAVLIGFIVVGSVFTVRTVSAKLVRG
ncbi:MAG TPA: ABC transporter permease [Candidatus Limnocylindrales bacterium]|jgi:lipooligosaccharide transport system permease protein|nr:ABC transporter permease [Candidatus Limnocylindrales bacterium]